MAEKPTRDIYIERDGEVYKLLYSLYGLDDAAKVFNDGLVRHLKSGGYVQSLWDQCLFYKWISPFQYIYLVFHVDDFNACASSEAMISEFQSYLSSKYVVTSNDDGVFLGIRCSRQLDNSMLYTKPHQLQSIFEKYLPNGPNYTIPKEPMRAKYLEDFELESEPCDSTLFRSLLGALMQQFDVRADIAYPVSKIAQKTESPRILDFEALMYVVHYLFGSKDRGLKLRPGDHASAQTMVRLRGYGDCGYANNINGKSQYCICFDLVPMDETIDELNPLARLFNSGMFYLKSWMAPTVDLSSCEGEIGTVVELCKDTVFYRGILAELHQVQVEPTPLYNDNKSSLTLATKYSGKHRRVRYMLPKIQWLMEKSKEMIFKLLYLHTSKLPPDLGTKNHTGITFRNKADVVLGV